VTPMILAGTSAHGVCSACGNPYVRVVERTEPTYWSERKAYDYNGRKAESKPNDNYMSISKGRPENSGVGYRHVATTGWAATCACDAPVVPATVLDCFSGAGTTAIVAKRLGRRFIGIDLNEEYCQLAQKRIEQEQPPLLVVA